MSSVSKQNPWQVLGAHSTRQGDSLVYATQLLSSASLITNKLMTEECKCVFQRLLVEAVGCTHVFLNASVRLFTNAVWSYEGCRGQWAKEAGGASLPLL